MTSQEISEQKQWIPPAGENPIDALHKALGKTTRSVSAADFAKMDYYADFRVLADRMADFCSMRPELAIGEARIKQFVDIFRSTADVTERLELLMNACVEIFSPICNLYLAALELGESLSLDEAAWYERTKNVGYARRAIIRPDAEADLVRQVEDPAARPYMAVVSMLNFGIKNSAHHSWSIFDVIPRVWSNNREAPLTPEAYEIAEKSGRALLKEITSCEDDPFHGILLQLRGPGEFKEPWPPYQAECFTLTAEGELTLVSEMYPTAHLIVTEYLEKNKVSPHELRRGGCPALPLIMLIFDWCSRVNREVSRRLAGGGQSTSNVPISSLG